jgi:hypothetical protein
MPSFVCSEHWVHKQHILYLFFFLFAFVTVDVEFVTNTDALMQIPLPSVFLSMIIRYSSISDSNVRRTGGVFHH